MGGLAMVLMYSVSPWEDGDPRLLNPGALVLPSGGESRRTVDRPAPRPAVSAPSIPDRDPSS